ncbi:MAG: HEPN domain-containing protein [Magnetococcales bacterium]|nr:HEPN domain-containing protein [Magnetococcales bacterium]
MDIHKHVEYWKNSSSEDWDVAMDLIERGKIRHGLFFLHLSIEKLLKGHVTCVRCEPPPRTHNLPQLLRYAQLPCEPEQLELLATLNEFCLAGRYMDEQTVLPEASSLQLLLTQIREVRAWLLQTL